MKVIKPSEVSVVQFQQLLQGAVSPRPIAFASTVDKDGNVNLSPFSFFNIFSSNPPILIFSPSRRVRDNTTKHTLENVLEVPEVTIGMVNYEMVQQMSLASTEYERGVNEFVKSGLTPIESSIVKPPRVKESPVSFECKVIEIKPLGDGPGAGNLIICEVLLAHVSEDILEDGKISPFKLDSVARMGGNWYCRANGAALFEVPKPLETKGIGVDQIPDSIRFSKVLTGNHLGLLGNVEVLPSVMELSDFTNSEVMKQLPDGYSVEMKHKLAASLLDQEDVITAWKVLLQ